MIINAFPPIDKLDNMKPDLTKVDVEAMMVKFLKVAVCVCVCVCVCVRVCVCVCVPEMSQEGPYTLTHTQVADQHIAQRRAQLDLPSRIGLAKIATKFKRR